MTESIPERTMDRSAKHGDLADLLARVEAAEGPNFELECSIFEALAMPTEWFGSPVTSHFRMGGGYGFNTSDGFRHLDCLKAPAYTASLDAALALVERVKPGWGVRMDIHPGSTEASVEPRWKSLDVPRDQSFWAATLPTPALALLAALLKALIAEAASPTGGQLGPGTTP
jgi:hypothetical protein